MSCPRIGDCRTVRQVVDAHAAHGTRYGPLELGASWNTLGKLVRQQSEKHVLRGAQAVLQPLAEHTKQALPKFGERPLANTVNGLANLYAARSWWASDALWAGLATHCTARASAMKAQEIAKRVPVVARARGGPTPQRATTRRF